MSSRNYINNKDLFEALVKHIEAIKAAEAAGEEKPRVPNYIGEAIWKIADNLGKRGNFSGYSFLSEMKYDGIENCLKYLHNFNPEKSNNPFAYFTRIIWFAFLRRIQEEKKQQYIKYILSKQHLSDHFDPRVDGNKNTVDYERKMAEFAEKFEQDNNIKKAKKKGIEKFTDE